MLRAVILAGGSGTRLWPMSRLQLPKQFLCLDGPASLLEATVARLAPLVAPEQVLVVTAEASAMGEAFQALAPYEKLLEPAARNTAPAIALAATWFLARGEDPVLVVLPADHIIRDVPAFHACLRQAVAAAGEGALVTFGIEPTGPETGFGYVKARAGGAGLPVVERFKEKPDAATAAAFLAEGGWYWNSGMFVWKASAIAEAIARTVPELDAVMADIAAAARAGEPWQEAVRAHFPRSPKVSIDEGVLERCGGLRLVPAAIGWSDVGSWDAVHDVAEKDEDGNSTQGNVLAFDCRDTLIRGGKRLVAAVGVEGISVIETPDAVLVARRGASQDVRKVVDALVRRSAQEHREHLTVRRPWGAYTVLECGPGFKIKRIEVAPGGRLSLQSHDRRSEHWVVVAGEATVTRGEAVTVLRRNESAYVPIGQRHRLENRGAEPLHLIEVQVGDYLEEDDIRRYDDHYGR